MAHNEKQNEELRQQSQAELLQVRAALNELGADAVRQYQKTGDVSQETLDLTNLVSKVYTKIVNNLNE